MPEHDLDDLDATFARLERDVAATSVPRGAGAAIATSRRRRRTTVGAVAAATVLVVAGVAVAQGAGSHDSSVGPADLPDPAPFDAAALTAATEGWQTDWHQLTKPNEISLQGAAAPRCLGALADDFDKPATPGPVGGGGGILVSRGGAATLTTLAEWGADHPDASTVGYAAVVASIDNCAQASPDREYTWDGAEGRSWTISVRDQESQHLWVARTNRAVGVVWAGGSAGAVPAAVDQRVAAALVAGLQSPESFTQIGASASGSDSASDSGSATASPATLATISSADFAAALGGWSSGWSPQGGKESVDSLPCSASDGGASYGSGSSMGSNGDQEMYGYNSAREASGAVQSIANTLRACTEASYDVSEVSLGAEGLSVTVAASTGSGNAVVWLAQDGPKVYVVAIPAGDSPPPQEVSQAVGGLMLDSLHGVSEGTAGGPTVTHSLAPGVASATPKG